MTYCTFILINLFSNICSNILIVVIILCFYFITCFTWSLFSKVDHFDTLSLVITHWNLVLIFKWMCLKNYSWIVQPNILILDIFFIVWFPWSLISEVDYFNTLSLVVTNWHLLRIFQQMCSNNCFLNCWFKYYHISNNFL